jgi:hypothetical protein
VWAPSLRYGSPAESLTRPRCRIEIRRPSMGFAGSSRTWLLAGFRDSTPHWEPAVGSCLGPVDFAYKIPVAGRWPSPLDLPGLVSIPAEAVTAVTFEVLPESCAILPVRAWMSPALRDLHVLFEDASQVALSSPVTASSRRWNTCLGAVPSASRPRPGRIQRAGFDSSLGVVQRLPLRRHTLRASTPGFDRFDASASPLSPFGLDLPLPGSFRPCRSSRLRRFTPLERRRLVASCSQPWGSLRFRPCRAACVGAVSDCSVVHHCLLPGRLLSRSVRPEIPISGHPPKVFPPPKPYLAFSPTFRD